MRRSLKVLAVLASGAFTLGAGASNASVIDFTSASTGHSGSLFGGKVTWTMTASGILNNNQLYDGNTKPVGTGLAFERDGYGVGKNDDEITTTPTKQEWIQVSFSKPTFVDAFYYLDLFVAKNRKTWEVGQAAVNGGAPYSLVATDVAGSGAPGFVATVFKPILARVIRFTVLSSNDNYGFADGALAGIGLAPVPLPAAGLMMIAGLGGLAGLRRARKA